MDPYHAYFGLKTDAVIKKQLAQVSWLAEVQKGFITIGKNVGDVKLLKRNLLQ